MKARTRKILNAIGLIVGIIGVLIAIFGIISSLTK